MSAPPLRVIVTRPTAQAGGWVESLRSLGIDAVALPLIGIEPLADPGPLRAAWARLDRCALVVFVSANAVQHFFDAAPDTATWPQGAIAGSTGPGTTAALRAVAPVIGLRDGAIVEPAADAPTFDSEALWRRLAAREWRGRNVMVVRGEEGRDWLADALRGAGASVEFVAAYRRTAPRLTPPEAAVLAAARAAPARHLWLFSSSEAVRHLVALAPGADWSPALAAASHPRIADAARAAGFGRVETIAARPGAAAECARRLPQALGER